MREPDVFTAGDTVSWYRSLTDYPPPVWILSYVFVGVAGKFEATAIQDPENEARHAVRLAPEDTEGIVDGMYSWHGAVTDGVDRYTIGVGTTRVLANLADSPAGRDSRPWAARVLDALEATLAETATTDQASYSIGGVSLSRMPVDTLLEWRDKMRMEVARIEAADRVAKGLDHPDNIWVRL